MLNSNPQPKQTNGPHQVFTLIEVREENPRTKTFIFKESLICQPGQFVMAWLPGIGEKPFSIAGSEPLALTVVAVGPVSEAIHRLKPGERLWVRGPLGRPFRPRGRRVLLAGGGYGAAPLFYLAQTAMTMGAAVDICIGARSAEDVLLANPFRQAGASVHITTEDGSLGTQGIITLAVEALLADPASKPDGGVYACGPVKMLTAIDELCARYHVSRQLSWEAHMRCGMGLCGSCEIQLPQTDVTDEDEREARAAWLVCMDGPVSETNEPNGS